MMMFVLLGILSLLRAALGQKNLTWTGVLPTGYQLLPGDFIKVPLDGYVSVKGTNFRTATLATTMQQISGRLGVKATIDWAQGPEMTNCRLSLAYSSLRFYLICGNRWIYLLQFNSNYVKDPVIFSKSEMNGVAGGLPLATQKCTDIVQGGTGKILVLCFDTASATQNFYIFEAPYAYQNIALPAVARYTICNNAGWVQGADIRMTSGWYTGYSQDCPIIYSVSPPGNPLASQNLNYLSCVIDQSAASGSVNAFSLERGNFATLFQEPALVGSIRLVTLSSYPEFVVVVAQEDVPGNKSLVLGGVNRNYWYGSLGLISSPFILSYLPIPQMNNIHQLGITTWSTSSTPTFEIFDGLNLYHYVYVTQRNTAPYYNSLSKVGSWSMIFDCGTSQFTGINAVAPSRIAFYGSASDINGRLSVEFRNILTGDLVEFGIYLGNNDFICSRTSGYADGAVQTTLVQTNVKGTGGYDVYSFKDKTMYVHTINPTSYLQFTAGSTPGRFSIPVTASLAGWISPPTAYVVYDVFASFQDIIGISLPVLSLRCYSGYRQLMPYTSFSFGTAAGKYSTAAPNGRVLHALVLTYSNFVTLDAIFPTIDRIMVVDNGTLAFVLRKNNNYENIIFVNISLDTSSNATTVVSAVTPILPRIDQGSGHHVTSFISSRDAICAMHRDQANLNMKDSLSCYYRSTGGFFTSRWNFGVSYAITYAHYFPVKFMISDRVEFWITQGESSYYDYVYWYPRYLMMQINFGATQATSPLILVNSQVGVNLYPNSQDTNNCNPLEAMQDYWGDIDNIVFLTYKYFCVSRTPPAMMYKSAVQVSNTTYNPSSNLQRSMPMSTRDFTFCVTRGEIVFYQWRQRKIWSQVWDRANVAKESSKFLFPLSNFGVVQVMQFLCIPEASAFQVLGVMADGTKKLLTFRGGESSNASRRAHSEVVVLQQTTFIDATYNGNTIMTALTIPGASSVTRQLVYIYLDGPHYIFDNSQATGNYTVDVKAQGLSASGPTVAVNVDLQFLLPMTNNNITPTKNWINAVGTTFNLDDAIGNTPGPVIDLLTFGDTSVVNVTKRLTRLFNYNVGGRGGVPDKVLVKGDWMVTLLNNSYLQISVDPTLAIFQGSSPRSIATYYTQPGQIRDAVLLLVGTGPDAILVSRTFNTATATPNNFQYNIHYLSKTLVGTTPTYTVTNSTDLYNTVFEMKKMAGVLMPNGDVVVALSNNLTYVSNYVRLICFRKQGTSSTFLKYSDSLVLSGTSREIANLSLTHDGVSRVIMLGTYKYDPKLVMAFWLPDGSSGQPNLIIQSQNPFPRGFPNTTRCWNVTNYSLECYIGVGDAFDSLYSIKLNSTLSGLDPIVSITWMMDFQIPSGFTAQKVERSRSYYAILARRVKGPAVTRRVLQSSGWIPVDDYLTCQQVILVYKPSYNRYVYTGSTCSDFQSPRNMDFSFESDGSYDYLYFPKGTDAISPTTITNSVVVQRISTPSVTILGSVDPKNFKFTFVGLRGTIAAENKFCLLDDFVLGSPPTSTFPWLMVILITLGVLLLGAVGFFLFRSLKQKAENFQKAGYRRSENESVEGKYGKGTRGSDSYHDEIVDKKLIFL